MSLTTAEATALLGVKPATLYSYVSRGLVRSEPGPAGTRERRYNADDVHALVQKQSLRRDPDHAVQDAVGGALSWGVPVLDSALTRIEDGRLVYRGQDAIALADNRTVEEVASLLWTADLHGWAHLPLRARLNLSAQPRSLLGVEALSYALVHAGAHDILAMDTRPEALPSQAARVLSLLYATLERHQGIPAAPDLALHIRLARLWGVPDGGDLLRRALILLADHELNVSTFTARVTASSGASLHHSTLAALCALQGPRHGLAVLEASDLLTHAQQIGSRNALIEATRRLGRPPGFGHRLYLHGDPRAASLFEALTRQRPESEAVQVSHALIELTRSESGEFPNVDLALAALLQALGRGPDDAVTLFALARSSGWLAHAIETVVSGHMIRPRARYVGVETTGT